MLKFRVPEELPPLESKRTKYIAFMLDEKRKKTMLSYEDKSEPVVVTSDRREVRLLKQYTLPELSICTSNASRGKGITASHSPRAELELEDEERPMSRGCERRKLNNANRYKEMLLGDFTSFASSWQRVSEIGPSLALEKKVSKQLDRTRKKSDPQTWNNLYSRNTISSSHREEVTNLTPRIQKTPKTPVSEFDYNYSHFIENLM
jgi:hypothetical protein